MSEFYPSLCWVPKASFALLPRRAEVTEEYQQLLAEELRNHQGQGAGGPSNSDNDESEAAEAARIQQRYRLDDYDDDEDGGDFPMGGDDLEAEEASDQDPDDEAAEDEDYRLQESDNLLVVAQVRQQPQCLAQAQVHVYNEPQKQFYLHHDFYLDSLPLCFEWVGGAGRNLLAVGRMEPSIQLWDLDVVDSLTRLAELGPPAKATATAKAKKKKKKKGQKQQQQQQQQKKEEEEEEGHSDAVLDVAWNRQSQQALASASADASVRVWDLQSQSSVRCLRQHSDKAQTLQWHPAEAEILLTGSYDRTVRVADCRRQQATADASALVWRLDGECERVLWDHRNPLYFFCSTDAGSVLRCDARAPGASVEQLAAHAGACCGLALSDQLLCTAGNDGSVRLWRPDANCRLRLLAERHCVGVGEATRLVVNPDCDCVLAVCGTQGFQVWDTRDSAQVRAYLSSRGLTMPEA